jgi:ArsR family transcriptional regulator, arsenate/arsenite/antimonite-responsive transcriptional repressor
LKIIDMLSCGELCACDILEQVHITQSTLSYHMKILTESGIIKAVKDGSWMRYSINPEVSDDMTTFLTHLTLEKEECICVTNKKC